MDEPTMWWLMAAALVALELFTGTFYLLMLAVGLAAGALAAHLGVSFAGQLVAAALVGTAAVVIGHLQRRKHKGDPSVRSLRSVNLDVGETLRVDDWKPDGTASVRYRGAQWTAVLEQGQVAEAGNYRVTELVGNRLKVERV
ncbi:NfeD family protein [Hydrogenophaga pseudoflava]|uniref:NfeD family protein n=1 Tax=Hydrogenophaga pseudoflava TaxID=47421 RepID=UPI0027E3EF1F|nr:NfeD family protein [Hydrogenophaga pseudoflava]MDQ7746407.1 NfeD family protein [Hydrogenophaga pseudoflava]